MLTRKRHKNSGPKFGIGLLPRQFVRPIRSLEDRLAPESEDLLHIPTPWHNYILRLEHDPMLYLVKSGLVQEALDKKSFDGEWVTSGGYDGCQGHFYLKSSSSSNSGSSEQVTNGGVEGERKPDKMTSNGILFGSDVKLDIHLLKKEGLRLKMLATTAATGKEKEVIPSTFITSTPTAASTATSTNTTSGKRNSGSKADDGDEHTSSDVSKGTGSSMGPVRFLQWAIGRVLRLRLLRWLQYMFHARAKVD